MSDKKDNTLTTTTEIITSEDEEPITSNMSNDSTMNSKQNDQTRDNLIFGGVLLVLVFALFMLGGTIFKSLGVNSGQSDVIQPGDNEKTNNLFIILIIVILVILLVAGGLRYLFRTSLYTTFTENENGGEIDVIIDHKTITKKHTPTQDQGNDEPVPHTAPSSTIKGDQVFNIPGQYFNYDKAQNLCKAYDARLATYDEIENAYRNGAEWCNYGWSEGQMALYPTQKSTYDALQEIPGHEHSCGRPGINGGYMANPDLQFGVNCYGKKPAITSEEEYLMENTPLYPLTEKDIEDEREVDKLKNKLKEILVSPFNKNTWSRY